MKKPIKSPLERVQHIENWREIPEPSPSKEPAYTISKELYPYSSVEVASRIYRVPLFTPYPKPSSEARVALATLVDGEGCITIGKRGKYYAPVVCIINTDIRLLEINTKRTGGFGKVYKGGKETERAKQGFAWHVSAAQIPLFLSWIYDDLIIKKEQALCVLEFCGLRYLAHAGPSYAKKLKELHAKVRWLNKKGPQGHQIKNTMPKRVCPIMDPYPGKEFEVDGESYRILEVNIGDEIVSAKNTRGSTIWFSMMYNSQPKFIQEPKKEPEHDEYAAVYVWSGPEEVDRLKRIDAQKAVIVELHREMKVIQKRQEQIVQEIQQREKAILEI